MFIFCNFIVMRNMNRNATHWKQLTQFIYIFCNFIVIRNMNRNATHWKQLTQFSDY